MGWARTYCRYRQESVSPKSVAISPSRSSRVSSTRANPIRFRISCSMSSTGDTSSACSGGMSARASRENHAPMLLERRLMWPQRPRRYAITPRSSGTTCQGTKPDSSFRAPCSGRSMASTCAPLGQTISPKAAPSSLQPHLPWTNSQTRSDGSPYNTAEMRSSSNTFRFMARPHGRIRFKPATSSKLTVWNFP